MPLSPRKLTVTHSSWYLTHVHVLPFGKWRHVGETHEYVYATLAEKMDSFVFDSWHMSRVKFICVEVSGAKSYVSKFKSRAPNGTHVILTRDMCSIWRPRLQLLHLPTTTSAHTYTHVTLAARIDVVAGWCRSWSLKRKMGHDALEKRPKKYKRLSPGILNNSYLTHVAFGRWDATRGKAHKKRLESLGAARLSWRWWLLLRVEFVSKTDCGYPKDVGLAIHPFLMSLLET